jgi:hypothetical protein
MGYGRRYGRSGYGSSRRLGFPHYRVFKDREFLKLKRESGPIDGWASPVKLNS